MNKWQKFFTWIGIFCLLAAIGLASYNFWNDAQAEQSAKSVLQQMEDKNQHDKNDAKTSNAKTASENVPDYVLNPEMDMPVQKVGGQGYIGVLQIEPFGLKLPVISDWNYPNLKIAPCRYLGSAYQNNMIIAAHNFRSHFGRLKNLSPGDRITFTDTDGNIFYYKVTEIEILSPYAVQDMISGDWDLTLFTCTIGGRTRVTVRCKLDEENVI